MEADHLPPNHDRVVTERRPSKDFANLIEKFWFAPENISCGQKDYEILPDGNFDLLFLLKDSCCKLLFAGPYTKRTCITMSNDYDCFGIRFRPGKMPRVADVQAVDLADAMIVPSRILGMDIDTLGEQLYPLKGIDSKQAFLEDVFRKAGLKCIARGGLGSRSAELIESCGGQIKVNDLARLFGVSRRTMERVFLAEAGVSPKAFIRCVRFQNVITKMRSGRYHSLAELAYDCGYADQSHFIKDYKQLSGRLPGCP